MADNPEASSEGTTMRRAKIIATIGPASRDPETLDRLIATGMDCARLNFSHGTLAEHAEVIRTVHELSQKHGRLVAILQDLAGIKLRLDVHFISSLPVKPQPVCTAWVDKRPAQIVAAEG